MLRGRVRLQERERDRGKTGAAANRARKIDAGSCCSGHGSGCSEVARRRQVWRTLGGRVGRGKAKVRLSSMSSLSSSLLGTDARAGQIGGGPDWEGTGPGRSRATGQGGQGRQARTDGCKWAAGGVGTVDRTHPWTAGGVRPCLSGGPCPHEDSAVREPHSSAAGAESCRSEAVEATCKLIHAFVPSIGT